jgi:PIN domain nuclease of toxin-antitoxin system
MILLDTHVVVWLLAAEDRLSARARAAILECRLAGESLAFSPVSAFEIAYSAGRGRLPLDASVEDFMASVQSKLELAPLTAEIAICAANLPTPFHGDPIDRMIAATAIVNDCTLITRDGKIRQANACKTLW